MSLHDNLDIYDKFIAKKRVEAYKKAMKTITEINFRENLRFFIVEYIPPGNKKKVKNN